MKFSLLGATEVSGEQGPYRLGGPKQRALLVLLLLNRNHVVPRDHMIDALWGERPPKTAAHTVQVFVSDLRKVLAVESAGRLVTKPPGYLLTVRDGELDIDRFERLTTEGREALRQGRPETAATRLAEALSLWRGPCLAEVAGQAWAQPEIDRLEQLRLACLEDRVEADLARGRSAELVGELEALVAEHPLRERFRGQLMLALYRSGRQADALASYRDARRIFVEQLGIEPGAELRELHARLLRQDADLAAPSRKPGPGPRLPVPATSLVGRERELAELLDLVADEDVRLLTLTGPGGIGKTRLALALAERLAGGHAYLDGVQVVELAPLQDAELVLPTVGQALGVGEHAAEPIGVALARAIADRELLVVLDNMEHVLAAAPAVAELLAACPGLRLIATSRQPLHLRAEHEYQVLPLTEDESVELFSRRARAVRPGFVAEPEVRAICRRLDCLPLAVELAAARVKLLAPAAILRRLERRLPLLTDGPTDAPARQRTMRSAIDWSYEHLSADEQRLFARLSVFAGGFTLEVAEDVCEAELPVLASLVEKSLVRGDGRRFTMLDVIAEYAGEHLQRTGEADEVRQRHAAWILELTRQAEDGLRGADEQAWLDRLAGEQDNIRVALGWLRRTGQTDAQLDLVGSIWPFWYVRGDWRESRRWVEHALGESRGSRTLRRAKALRAAWGFAHPLGDLGDAEGYAAESLEIFSALGDRGGMARALGHLAAIATERADYPEAERLFSEAISHARDAGDPRTLALTMGNLGDLAMRQGDHLRAVALLDETITRLRDLALEEPLGWSLCNLAFLHLVSGRPADAVRVSHESLAIAHRLGDIGVLIWNLVLLGSVAGRDGEAETGARLLGAADALREQVSLALTGLEGEVHRDATAQLRKTLGPEPFEVAYAGGRAMTTDEAVAAASLAAAPLDMKRCS